MKSSGFMYLDCLEIILERNLLYLVIGIVKLKPDPKFWKGGEVPSVLPGKILKKLLNVQDCLFFLTKVPRPPQVPESTPDDAFITHIKLYRSIEDIDFIIFVLFQDWMECTPEPTF